MITRRAQGRPLRNKSNFWHPDCWGMLEAAEKKACRIVGKECEKGELIGVGWFKMLRYAKNLDEAKKYGYLDCAFAMARYWQKENELQIHKEIEEQVTTDDATLIELRDCVSAEDFVLLYDKYICQLSVLELTRKYCVSKETIRKRVNQIVNKIKDFTVVH